MTIYLDYVLVSKKNCKACFSHNSGDFRYYSCGKCLVDNRMRKHMIYIQNNLKTFETRYFVELPSIGIVLAESTTELIQVLHDEHDLDVGRFYSL